MGMTSLTNYVAGTGVVIGPWVSRFWPVYAYVVLAILAPAFISIAALIVLGREQFIVPVVFALVVVSYVWISPTIANPIDVRSAIAVVSSIMYIPAVLLFGYLLVRTRKATSLGLFYLVTFYPLYSITLTALPPFPIDLISLVVGLRLFGPAIAFAAFQLRDIGISVELVIYGMAFAFISFWFSYVMISSVTDATLITSLTLIALGCTIGFGTSGYTYARWKKSRVGATFALFLSFMVTTCAFILVALGGVGLASAVYYTYATIVLTFIGLMCFNMAAFLGLEWRTLLLLPVLMMVPLFLFLAVQYPVNPTANPFFTPVVSITGLSAAVVPVALYLYLWQRMRHASTPSASRPLLFAMGILELTVALAVGSFILGAAVLDVANPISGILILGGFLAWWLGVTGRSERFTKWWHFTTVKPKPIAASVSQPEGTSSSGGA